MGAKKERQRFVRWECSLESIPRTGQRVVVFYDHPTGQAEKVLGELGFAFAGESGDAEVWVEATTREQRLSNEEVAARMGEALADPHVIEYSERRAPEAPYIVNGRREWAKAFAAIGETVCQRYEGPGEQVIGFRFARPIPSGQKQWMQKCGFSPKGKSDRFAESWEIKKSFASEVLCDGLEKRLREHLFPGAKARL